MSEIPFVRHIIHLPPRSVYGRCAMNSGKFKQHRIVDMDHARILVGRPSFVSALELNDECFEITSHKETVREDVPLQIALQVYDLVSFFKIGIL